ncbi:serine/arginine repetitive matrix protein 1-like [Mustela putorius furo]|uniref:Serine/arginine repetitive matrix protein 1-like n=1 Tax=Mustela putorius furo TaxID=9669 RepID=A0A8U0RHI4_MUSPF|nr:serine/arginine repetitive matrix protein 1-like [Mustela putorius furo]
MTTDQVPATPPPKRDFRFGTADARARRAGVRETEKAVTRLRVRPTRSSERSRASSPALTESFPLFRSRRTAGSQRPVRRALTQTRFWPRRRPTQKPKPQASAWVPRVRLRLAQDVSAACFCSEVFSPRNRCSGQKETGKQSRGLRGLSPQREESARRPQAPLPRRRSRPGARYSPAQRLPPPRPATPYSSSPHRETSPAATSRAPPGPRARGPAHRPRPSRAYAHRARAPRAAGRALCPGPARRPRPSRAHARPFRAPPEGRGAQVGRAVPAPRVPTPAPSAHRLKGRVPRSGAQSPPLACPRPPLPRTA